MADKIDIKNDPELLSALEILLEHDVRLRENILSSAAVLVKIKEQNGDAVFEVEIEQVADNLEPTVKPTTNPYIENNLTVVQNNVNSFIYPLEQHFKKLLLTFNKTPSDFLNNVFDLSGTKIETFTLTGGVAKNRAIKFVLIHNFDGDDIIFNVSVFFEHIKYLNSNSSTSIKIDRHHTQISDFYSAAFMKAYEMWLDGHEAVEIFRSGPNVIVANYNNVDTKVIN